MKFIPNPIPTKITFSIFHSNFKTDFSFENYLTRLSKNNRIWIRKLRTCNLKIPIEMGRWKKYPKRKCSCHLCNEKLGMNFITYLFVISHIY